MLDSWRTSLQICRCGLLRCAMPKEMRVGAEIRNALRPGLWRRCEKGGTAAAPLAVNASEACLAPGIDLSAGSRLDAKPGNHAVHQLSLARNPFEGLRAQAEIGHGPPPAIAQHCMVRGIASGRLIQIKLSCGLLGAHRSVDRRSSQRRSCRDCAVRESALCRVLTAEQLTGLNRSSFRKRYAAGQLIAGVMPTEEWCGTILSGVVKLTKSLPDGRHRLSPAVPVLIFWADRLVQQVPVRQKRRPRWSCAATGLKISNACDGAGRPQAVVPGARFGCAVDAAREWMVLLGRKNAREKTWLHCFS